MEIIDYELDLGWFEKSLDKCQESAKSKNCLHKVNMNGIEVIVSAESLISDLITIYLLKSEIRTLKK